MSLKDQLLQKGSNGTKWDGTQPPQNVGTTKQSLLHADGGNEKYGYSTGGDYFPQVNDAANSYDNGNSFPLPIPSQLDMGLKSMLPNTTTNKGMIGEADKDI